MIMALAGVGIAAATPVYAKDLHGFCTPACPDNGTNSPTSADPPIFGFSAAGGPLTGILRIDILVPSNVSQPSSYTIMMGGNPFTASRVSATPWSSGQLDSYLGISGSPTNPIGAYGAASSYLVYQAILGSVTVPDQGSPGTPYLSFASGESLLTNSYIVAFLDTDPTSSRDKLLATANSAAILETGRPPALPEPATWGLMLLGFAGVGAAMRGSRKSKPALMQIA